MSFRDHILIIFLLCGVFSSCELKTSEDSLPESVGKYGQILVVIDTAYESGPVGDFITELLVSPMYGLPQAEGKFNVSTVPHAGFKDILKRATNIIVINIRRGGESKFQISDNKWAKGQTVLNISGSSVKNVRTILEQNAEAILDLFKQKELDRRKAHLKQFPKKQSPRHSACCAAVEFTVTAARACGRRFARACASARMSVSSSCRTFTFPAKIARSARSWTSATSTSRSADWPTETVTRRRKG